MQERLTVAMLGGDLRQVTVAKELEKKGYTVLTSGLFSDMENWRETVTGADIVITGLPMTEDGIHLYAPMYGGERVSLHAVMEHARGKRFLGGRIPKEWLERAERFGIACTDYFAGETLQIQNALPSAEGAIFLAMQELPVVLSGCSIAVIGYGRIGKLLSQKLRALDADVTVYARRDEVVAEAKGTGVHARRITYETLSEIGEHTRILFNTVPQCLFDRSILTSFPKGCVYIELASFPGGIDRAAARELGISVRPGGGLPGKYAPETAGYYLSYAIDELIQRES